MSSGTKEATYPLDTGGVVYLAWPEGINSNEIEDLENWMQTMMRKMKRAAESASSDPPLSAQHSANRQQGEQGDDE